MIYLIYIHIKLYNYISTTIYYIIVYKCIKFFSSLHTFSKGQLDTPKTPECPIQSQKDCGIQSTYITRRNIESARTFSS